MGEWKGKDGRPRKYNDEQIQEIIDKMEAYIKDNDIPILSEFSYKNNIGKDIIYEYQELSEIRKKLIAKKEANLEKGALSGDLVPSVAIFSLKQLGWSDKKEIKQTITILDELEKLSDEELDARIREME